MPFEANSHATHNPGVTPLHGYGSMPVDARSMASHSAESSLPVLAERGMYVPLASGPAYFNYFWLRDACPSAIDPETRERIYDLSELTDGPRARAASIVDGCLLIDWQHEAHRSCLPLATLESLATGDGRLPDTARLPRRLWYASDHPSTTRIEQSAIEGSDEARMRFARALIEDGVALVTGMEDSDQGLTRLAETLGPITPTVDGLYFDVRLMVQPTNLAYTARALEMHTDLPNEEAAPGVQFLHCRANTVAGGYSLFVDGAAVAEALREERPADFALLSSHDIPFFRRQDGWDYRAYQRVIELDHAGNVSGLTISQHLQEAIDLPQSLLDDYYPALCAFIRMLKQERFVSRFRLAAGECIVFDNHRIVHGREAFEAHSGERHLRGCYVDRGALRSTYRTLARRL